VGEARLNPLKVDFNGACTPCTRRFFLSIIFLPDQNLGVKTETFKRVRDLVSCSGYLHVDTVEV